VIIEMAQETKIEQFSEVGSGLKQQNRKLVMMTLILIAGLLVPKIYVIPGLGQEGTTMLGITFIAALLWMTEAVSIGVTGLVIILLQSITGILPLRTGLAFIANPVNAVVLVGFLLAAALVQCGLDKRISLLIITRMGEKTSRLMLGMMISAAFLSMWMSNTATVAIMVPIAVGILKMAGAEPLKSSVGKSMLIGIAYAANIGGMGTPTGTPANPITIALLRELAGIQLSFLDWMVIALPVVVLLVPLTWLLLMKVYPHEIKMIHGGLDKVKNELKDMGRIQGEEKKVLFIFGLAIFLWLLDSFVPIHPDWLYIVSVFMTIYIVTPRLGVLTWKKAQHSIGWDVLFLVGGGLSMGSGLSATGVIEWIATMLSSHINDSGYLAALFIVSIATALGITIFCSLSGTATTFVPVAIGLSLSFNWNPVSFAMMAGLASSFAFILPANAAPNAVAYGAGYFRTQDMAKVGVMAVLLSVVVLNFVAFMFF
jgi:solute carrier family 13 (sodium-dependent dicarboxylate transporter), member 2/3/5